MTLDEPVVRRFVFGHILGTVLRLRGVTCLHASSVVVDGCAVAFAGNPGAGKSTLAMALAQLGHAFLADDVAALNLQAGQPLVMPGPAQVRLAPDSPAYRAAFGRDLPPNKYTWEKYTLDLATTDQTPHREPAPLGAVYFLDERVDTQDAPYVRPLTPRDGLLKLVSHSYANYVLDQTLRRAEFVELSQVAEQVPIRELTPHADPARLDDLCRVVLDDLATLRRPQA